MPVVINGSTGITSPGGDTSAADNTINGVRVGEGGGSIANNTVVGYQAGNGNTTGDSLDAFGYQALLTNSTGNNNSAFGWSSLKLNTSGSGNAGFGRNTLAANTTGGTNSAFGAASLLANTTGSSNTAVGFTALFSNTTASNNTAVGYQALYTNTTGTEQVAVGLSALYAATTGTGRNTAIGYQALASVTTGFENTGLGRNAGLFSTGSQNTFIGANAGATHTTGNSNTYVGEEAGTSMTTGGSNTIIGRYSGNQGGLDIRTASNYIVLSDGDGNPRGVFDSNGTFGLKTTAFTVGTDAIRLDTTGRLLSNCNLDWNLELYGSNTQRVRLFSSAGNNTQVGSITVNTTNAAFNTSSDYRLKENISPMTGALDKVTQLKPCTYTWKVDGSSGEGFIAHELAEVIPQAVSGEKDALDKDGNISPQGIDTSYLVATLTAAIQELKAEVDSLKAQLNK